MSKSAIRSSGTPAHCYPATNMQQEQAPGFPQRRRATTVEILNPVTLHFGNYTIVHRFETRLVRQMFRDFETSFAFWLTAHRHLLGKQTKSTAPWLNDHGDFAGSLAGALFAFRRNSHYLRRAMHLWLTARKIQPHATGPAAPAN